jgi:hypothetical protein
MDQLDNLISRNGVVLIGGTNPHTTYSWEYLTPREGCVISSIKDVDGIEYLNVIGISGIELEVSDPSIRIPGGKVGKSVTLSAGTAWLSLTS